ncbi:hypothetical protein PHYPSEUDO_013492 [Phytophthora pseudosyringae]|uniref:Uncharacterized protein n=1 Tax=Phytophthora pseudosyringae TaxID=221518 RepID=A0A8T1WKR0_9STRA|nr:hypothetical protein PHYPSEUDO_013492 [Phytophthora pseudosyringae]
MCLLAAGCSGALRADQRAGVHRGIDVHSRRRHLGSPRCTLEWRCYRRALLCRLQGRLHVSREGLADGMYPTAERDRARLTEVVSLTKCPARKPRSGTELAMPSRGRRQRCLASKAQRADCHPPIRR